MSGHRAAPTPKAVQEEVLKADKTAEGISALYNKLNNVGQSNQASTSKPESHRSQDRQAPQGDSTNEGTKPEEHEALNEYSTPHTRTPDSSAPKSMSLQEFMAQQGVDEEEETPTQDVEESEALIAPSAASGVSLAASALRAMNL